MKTAGLLLLPLLVFFSCKQDELDILNKENRLARNAAVNVEIRKLKEKLAKAPDNAARSSILTDIAVLQSDKGDIASAMQSARESIALQPNEYMARYLLGKSYNESARYDEAIEELKISISFNNAFALSHFQMGNAWYKKLQYAKAMAEYREALRIDPKHVHTCNNLGVLFSAMGKAREAESSFKKIIELDPKYAVAYKNLGILYDTKLGDKKQAVYYYRKYLEVAPNNPDRQLVRAWLQVLGK